MYSVAHTAETDSSYTVSPMMRHDRKFNKRRKGLGSLARSPFSFWNSLIVQYFCLPHPHTSKRSHIALIIAASQHAPAKHQTFLVCSLCCPSPLLFPSGGLSMPHRDLEMFWGCFQRRPSSESADTLEHASGCCLQQSTAALPALPLTSLQQTLMNIVS